MRIIILLLFGISSVAWASNNGQFNGRIIVEWLNESGPDRQMRLIEDFEYIDSLGNSWKVPKGTVVDGASIPKLFWSIIGPPFVGDYRVASVVHDYYCQTKSKPWKDVHRIFYYASLAAGVDKKQAKVMYWAVYAAGPRWVSKETSRCSGCHITDRSYTVSYKKSEMDEIKKWVESTDPTTDEIERRIDSVVFDPMAIHPRKREGKWGHNLSP